MACHVIYTVLCPTVEAGEEDAVMCLTGNYDELGLWCPNRLVHMVLVSNTDSSRPVWKAEIDLPCDTEINYRYALCSFSEGVNGDRQVVVHRWETALRPRRLLTKGAKLCKEEEIFGCYDGLNSVDRGWLTTQSEIQLLIHGQPLTLQGQTNSDIPPIGIKITARQEPVTVLGQVNPSSKLRLKEYDILPTFVRVLNEDEYEPRVQQEHGIHFHKGDIIIFSVQTLKPESLSFKVEIFNQEIGHANGAENIGVATILGRNIGCSSSCIPVIDKDMDDVGSLEVSCCLIQPLQPSNQCSFEVSYSKYWNWTRRCLEIGHRGMGRSLVDTSLLVEIPANTNIPENTVKSLQEALKHGADFVEFDVHVTKDRVPVIGHDFQAVLKPVGQKSAINLEIPINYLNLIEIDSLKTGQCMVLSHTEQSCSCQSQAPGRKEMQLFPTLQFALEAVNPDLGFLIEVKYPMDTVDGSKEMPAEKLPLDRSTVINAILDVTLKYGGNRRIVLTAFDPYVCVMLRLMQNKYPVFFANFGPSERYELYEGPLCTGIPVASLFARSMGFLGLNIHSLDILRDPNLAVACNKAGVVQFCWGEDNNDDVIIQKLKDIGVQGVIHDSMSKYPDNRDNVFREEKRRRSPAGALS